MIAVTIDHFKFMFPTILFVLVFYTEKCITQFKTTEKMIGRHTRLRENDDLPL